MHVDIKVLGAFEVTVAGVSIVPTANKPSQVLAMLALTAGRVLTTDELIEEVWNQHPPRTAVTTIHTYIRTLRKRLREVPGDGTAESILLTRRNGYLLDVPRSSIDAVVYDRLSVLGRRAAGEGDYPTASRTLDSALDLWRGQALADVPTGPLLQIEAVRLEESRLSDLGLRIDVDLCLGRHHQLLTELATLCARYPLLENFCAQFMLALYRSDRQWQALQAYRHTRDALVEQLGVEPTTRLRQLHQEILAGNPTVDDPNFVFSGWVPQREPNSVAIS
ncbi:AfsR/SARP family transcriptional regulator [Actinophytocola sp.]|uniref:AfsR/SARP family transcriptional regulator n=1 Tax=Actinophytocola sp. TaxID=1872138 RepID=UPI002ED52F5D